MSEHTKGPWNIHPHYSGEPIEVESGKEKWVHWSLRVGPGEKIVADVSGRTALGGFPVPGNQAEVFANAHLIAAAPDLLEALEASIRMEWARRNREAIGDLLHPGILGAQIELEEATHQFAILRDSAIAKAKGGQP